MRLLLSGFTPFSGRPTNPSQDLITIIREQGLDLPGVLVTAVILPVEYAGVERALLQNLSEFRPDVYLAFGVGRRQTALRLESIGRNRDDCELPDNAGEIRQASVIDPGGPEIRPSTLDLSALQQTLEQHGFDAEIGDDAGGFVCNHLLYFGLKILGELSSDCRFVFTHLAPPEANVPIETLRRAVRSMALWSFNQQIPDSNNSSGRLA